VLIQWEDFRKDNALAILDRYRERVPSFNDDIQGPGAVAAACLVAASRISESPLSDTRLLIYGAGAAGLGIVRQVKALLRESGMQGDDLQRAILAMDSRGILSDGRESLEDYKKELAWPEAMAAQLGLSEGERLDLASVVKAYKPHTLIGTSGQAEAFDEAVVTTMAGVVDQPVILPMSNPTSISEGTPEKITAWSKGRALVATGSPFDDLSLDGKRQRIGQANNVFIFPGLGLGSIVSGASQVTDAMISASAHALADSLTASDRSNRCLMPEVSRLWEVSGIVGLAVAKQAVADGVATCKNSDDIEKMIDHYRWEPAYPEFVPE
jgi:malate dehydrogenase (oxaloacetate-decarboxylating)